jgi:hypothetical protein
MGAILLGAGQPLFGVLLVQHLFFVRVHQGFSCAALRVNEIQLVGFGGVEPFDHHHPLALP